MSNLSEIIRGDLIDFANEATELGMKLKSVRFQYNVQGHCTQALLSYEETEPVHVEESPNS